MSGTNAREHKLDQIAKLNREWGDAVEFISASANNHSCVIVVQNNAPAGTKAALDPKDEKTVRALLGPPNFRRIIFNNQIVTELDIYERIRGISISSDGTRVATCECRRDERHEFVIRINGKIEYEVPFDEFFDLAWIGPNYLAWKVGNENERGLHYFINGKETTGRAEFDLVGGERDPDRLAIRVWVSRDGENGNFLVFNDEGHAESFSKPLSFADWRRSNLPNDPKPKMPEKTSPNDSDSPVLITYNGRKHQPVDELENQGNERAYTFNHDRSKVAYIAVQYGKISRGVQSVLALPLRFSGAVGSWARKPGFVRPDYTYYIPRGRKIVLKVVKAICFVPMVIFTLLCNPYFGPLHHLNEARKRWYPVDDGHRWRKGYKYARDHFYTPYNELVVTAHVKGKWCVVINGDEGPLFDEIQNVRFVPEEDAVCYMAQKGENIYRVVAR